MAWLHQRRAATAGEVRSPSAHAAATHDNRASRGQHLWSRRLDARATSLDTVVACLLENAAMDSDRSGPAPVVATEDSNANTESHRQKARYTPTPLPDAPCHHHSGTARCLGHRLPLSPASCSTRRSCSGISVTRERRPNNTRYIYRSLASIRTESPIFGAFKSGQ